MPLPPGPGVVRIAPLGGLGEIGMNCLALEQSSGTLIVDCGTSFPQEDLGIDLIHPDFSWLLARRERVQGLFLTHGHEDHIGGVPYLLRRLKLPIWGPRHALGLVRHRLLEHRMDPDDHTMHEVAAGERATVGSFEVEPIRVAHSIVEATALAVRTEAGLVVHSGDFNFDPDPPDGEPTDEARLAALGDEGVALLMSDSTNVDVPQRAGSERLVGESLERLIRDAPARVFLALFASNVQRLMLLGEIAQRTGRKLCLLGRSISKQSEVAGRIGRLCWPSDLLVAPEDARAHPKRELILLVGGTQAEPNSALRRLASGVHPALDVEAGDTVILSSRVIPGNDRPVVHMMCDLLRRGALVHSRISEPGVHTSGHAGRSEQRRLIDLLRPRAFLPLHGTLHHLLRHAELAAGAGVAKTLVVENGTLAEFDGASLSVAGHFTAGKVSVSLGGVEMPAEVLRRRSELARSGLAMVAVAVNKRRQLASEPSVSTRGLPLLDDDAPARSRVAREVARQFERVRTYHGIDLEDELRRAARRKIAEISGDRAVVEVQILELE